MEIFMKRLDKGKLHCYNTYVDRKDMLNMRLEGRTYKHIATKAGITRQRVQQLLSPPKEVRDYVIKKYKGKCADCDIFVGKSAHIHHDNSNDENYNDIENLVCLCISCHRKRHRIPKSDKQKTTNKQIKNMKQYECKRCGRKWYPRKPEKPRVCPKCKSPYWDLERRRDV